MEPKINEIIKTTELLAPLSKIEKKEISWKKWIWKVVLVVIISAALMAMIYGIYAIKTSPIWGN